LLICWVAMMAYAVSGNSVFKGHGNEQFEIEKYDFGFDVASNYKTLMTDPRSKVDT
jgi:hypothetical protein